VVVADEVAEEEAARVLKMSVCLVASLANSASARPLVLYCSVLHRIRVGFMAVQPTLSFAGIYGTLYIFAVVGMAAAATTTITFIARFTRAGEVPTRAVSCRWIALVILLVVVVVLLLLLLLLST
jgi:hypothetical protein